MKFWMKSAVMILRKKPKVFNIKTYFSKKCIYYSHRKKNRLKIKNLKQLKPMNKFILKDGKTENKLEIKTSMPNKSEIYNFL